MKITHNSLLTLAALALTGIASAQPATPNQTYEQRIDEQQRQIDEMRRELDAIKGAQGNEPVVTDGTDNSRFIFRKNENLILTFSGRIHRMLLTVDDGANSDLFFTDSEQGPSMLRFDALGKVDDTLSVGAAIELGIRESRPFLVSQDNPEGGTGVNVRHADAILNSTRVGKFSLGRGFAAAWLAPEIDLSGTQFASLLPVGMLAPGMKFVDASDNSLSDIQVLTYFTDVERLLLVDRARYDSPIFGPGMQISSSVANDSRWDLALRLKPNASGSWKFVGGVAYLDKPFSGVDRRLDAGVSILHNPTGLNLTVAGSIDRRTGSRDSKNWLVKGGLLTDIVSLGKTAFSLDYFKVSDQRLDGDKADSVGMFAVQKWPAYGIDFYGGYRRYKVTRPDINLKNLDIYVVGVALNF